MAEFALRSRRRLFLMACTLSITKSSHSMGHISCGHNDKHTTHKTDGCKTAGLILFPDFHKNQWPAILAGQRFKEKSKIQKHQV
jgi:hypothetical protein